MKRSLKLKWLATGFLLVVGTLGHAQTDLTFYHLGQQTPQSSIYNPVFFPDANFYISLPVLSGVNMNLTNSFNYNDAFDPIDGTDSIQFNQDKFLSNIHGGDRLSFDATISLFQFGIRLGDVSTIQVFANERISGNFYYPKEIMTYLLRGNGSFLGEEVTENNLNGNGTYYREYGIGYTHQLQVLTGKRLRIGFKAKYLQGVLQAQVARDASLSITTDADDFSMSIKTNNPVIQTAGINYIDSLDYIKGNGNTGFGFDIGADLQISPKLSIALAANDIGSIDWSEDVKSYVINSSEVNFGGLDLKDLEDPSQILQDTIKQLFNYETDSSSYQSKLNTRLVASGTYGIFPKGSVSGTIMTQSNMGKWNWTYGVGYTHQLGRVLTLSGTVSHKPAQGFALGAGFAARFGFAQLYTSIDNVLGFVDVRKMQNMNVRIGINLLFGRNKPKDVEEGKEPKVKRAKQKISPFPEEYDLDHLEDLDDNN